MHVEEKILNNTTPYGKIRASHEGLLHSSTLNKETYVGWPLRGYNMHILAIKSTELKSPCMYLSVQSTVSVC